MTCAPSRTDVRADALARLRVSSWGVTRARPPAPRAQALEVHDYYPFGMRHATQAAAQGTDYRYEYTGAERVGQAIGLDWTDLNARQLDPALGVFNRPDPLADAMPWVSPYSYAFGDPINYSDPSGLMPESPGGPGLCALCGGSSGPATSQSSNAGFEQMRTDNQQEIADNAARAQLDRWFDKYLVDNPYAGQEVARLQRPNGQIDIFHEGAKTLVDIEAAERLGKAISRTGGMLSYMSVATGVYSQYHYSEELGTFLGRNGRHAYIAWGARKYAPVIAEAKAAGKMLGAVSNTMGALAVGAAGYEYFNSDMGIESTAFFAAEVAVARYSAVGGPQGIAVGVGWEAGRAVTQLPPYQRWRNRTWMPWRYRKLGY